MRQDVMCPLIGAYKSQVSAPDRSLTIPAAIARRELGRLVRDSGAGNEAQLARALAKHSKHLLAQDPSICVELAMFDTLCGDGSEARVLGVVTSMLPTADKAVDPATFAQGLTAFVASQQYKYAATAAQSKVKTVQKWANRIVGDLAPDLELASDCPLLLNAASRFQFFLRKEEPAKVGSKHRKIVCGQEALKVAYEAAKQRHAKGLANLGDCTDLVVWRYLGSGELREQIDALVAAIDVDAVPTKSSGATGSSSASAKAKAKGKAAKAAKANDEVEAAVQKALALFG